MCTKTLSILLINMIFFFLLQADAGNAGNVNSVKDCSTVEDCTRLPIFLNFGWEDLYRKNMLDLIKVLDVYNDVCRLYALAYLSNPYICSNVIIKMFLNERIVQHPDALKLTHDLKDIMPDVDPIYLDLVGEVFAFNQNNLFEFIEKITTKKKSYPKLQEYNVKVQDSKIITNLTVNFEVNEFLRLCPDPETYFKKVKLNSITSHYHESVTYLNYRLVLLYSIF